MKQSLSFSMRMNYPLNGILNRQQPQFGENEIPFVEQRRISSSSDHRINNSLNSDETKFVIFE